LAAGARDRARAPSFDSELRAAVDVNGIANDPPASSHARKATTPPMSSRNALERLHPKDDLASGIRLGEVRHVRLDDAGCDSIDADTAHAQAA